MNPEPERGVWIPDAEYRADLTIFADRVVRLDEAAVVRLRTRADGLVGVWAATGLGVLASRAVTGRIRPDDMTCGATELAGGLRDADEAGYVDPGYSMDAAWRGALPTETGFDHLDDVPASLVIELARQGSELAKTHGSAHGPPVSLLDQDVLDVGSGDAAVGVPMRCVFALTAMGFVPEPVPADEVVRIRATRTWLRIDARFGSVHRRTGGPDLLMG